MDAKEKILKSIGWKELFPETLGRLSYFYSNFRVFYSEMDISDFDLEKEVVYTFGIYGQGMVYDIYSKLHEKLDGETFVKVFHEFIMCFKEALPDKFNLFKPRDFIRLFIEYIYSLVIKNQ